MAKHRFIGDRDEPTLLAAVRTRRAVLGSGKVPEAIRTMRLARTVYAETDTKERPSIRVEAVHAAGKHLWKVSTPVGDTLRGARPGLTLERHPSTKFLDEVSHGASFKSHRPEWIDASTVPRIVPDKAQRVMRRFDGRRVRPLWVYDSARHAFQDSSWPWGVVGRVFNSRGETGTGTLVGDRVVVTAGHLVPWGHVDWWMRFVPAYFNGTSLFGAGVESYVSDARGYDTEGAGYDWAIARLYEPLGASLGYFGYNSYSSDWDGQPFWSNIGYPGDIDNAEQPAFQQGFTIGDSDGDDSGGEELETEDCDLNHGNSGGPCFAWWNSGTDPRIVGVVSSEETEYRFPSLTRNDNVISSGDGFVNLCAWGRTHWPA